MANNPRRLMPRTLTGGQTLLLGGAIVIASLGGFYFNLRRMHNKKERRGTLPHYEYLIAHVGSSDPTNPHPGAFDLPISRFEQRTTLLPSPQKEHRSGHSTIPNFKLSAAAAASADGETTKVNNRAHLEQPTPQRPKMTGSSVAYTKSPDYAKSYEKSSGAKPKSGPATTDKSGGGGDDGVR